MIRNASSSDRPAILVLNADSVHFLSPMDDARLAKFADAASYLRVIEDEGCVAAFLLAFRKGDDYRGVNFAWFAARYDDFFYVDRVVVAPAFRGRKFADCLYDDLESAARKKGVTLLTCEVNTEPPNPVSLRFHARRGFREVTQNPYAGKTVAMLVRDLS